MRLTACATVRAVGTPPSRSVPGTESQQGLPAIAKSRKEKRWGGGLGCSEPPPSPF